MFMCYYYTSPIADFRSFLMHRVLLSTWHISTQNGFYHIICTIRLII